MAARKRKPAQDWRDFATEVGIVVLGVLLALLAQQIAQALEWRDKVQKGREAIRQEMVVTAYSAAERVALKDCLEDRLEFLQAKLETAGAGWEGQPWGRLKGHAIADGQAYFSPVREWNTEVWRALVADGTASHFPRKEMLQLSSLYEYVDVVGGDNTLERSTLGPVAVLGRSFPLSDVTRARTELALEEQKSVNRMAALAGAQLGARIREAGLYPKGPEWDRELAGLRIAVANCNASRPTRLDAKGFPIAE